MRKRREVRLVAWALVVGCALPLVAPQTADALVFCRKKNKVKVRPDVCKGKETLVDPSELGVVPAGTAGGDLAGSYPNPTVADGAIGGNQIAAGAIDGNHIAAGTITADKLAPAAMAAAGSMALFNQDSGGGSTASTAPATLDIFTVEVPGPGVLTVTVQGMYWLDADSASTSALTAVAFLGLCDVADSGLDADCGSTYGELYVQDPDNGGDTNATPAFSLARTVPVEAAGFRTFYVNGHVGNAAHDLNLWGCSFETSCGATAPVATVVFTPATLSVTRPIL